MRTNGAMLYKYTNKRVSLIGTVQAVLSNNTSFNIQTDDGFDVTVNLKQPITENISGLVEVHGIAQGPSTINCNYYLMLPYELANTYGAAMDSETINLGFHIPNVWNLKYW